MKIGNDFGYLTSKTRETTRVNAVKFKINGRCINKCRFCPFHNDPHQLEVRDIAHFFDIAGNKPFKRLVVNGGEPTIHPRFSDICIYLRKHCQDQIISLGTNLIPFSWSSGRYTNLKETIFETSIALRWAVMMNIEILITLSVLRPKLLMKILN